jgi:hypothetical protein
MRTIHRATRIVGVSADDRRVLKLVKRLPPNGLPRVFGVTVSEGFVDPFHDRVDPKKRIARLRPSASRRQIQEREQRPRGPVVLLCLGKSEKSEHFTGVGDSALR